MRCLTWPSDIVSVELSRCMTRDGERYNKTAPQDMQIRSLVLRTDPICTHRYLVVQVPVEMD